MTSISSVSPDSPASTLNPVASATPSFVSTSALSAAATSDLAAAKAAGQTRLWGLIPCAGTGSRAGTVQAKQYQMVAGQPMVMHSLAAFAGVPEMDGILVVIAPGDDFFTNTKLPSASFSVANCGGMTRAQSVLNGLNALAEQSGADKDWVLVHDAARCLITPAQIRALIAACWHDDVGGLLALKLPDTLKSEAAGRVYETIDRADKWLAQTPQMFRLGPLRAALAQAQAAGRVVTDESSAMEAMGLPPKLVEGSAQNFKVTYPQDFAVAQALLLARQAALAE